jgi:enamine deaminase RidA (YjgF/YER057c/UK114 family)
MTNNIDQRLQQLDLQLPPAPPAGGVYHPLVRQGNLIYVSGQGPVQQNGNLIKGKIGKDIDRDAGKQAAKQVGLTMLATLKAHFGSLDEINRLVKLFGMVNCTPDFEQQPYVINGCSELFASLWGKKNGIGARSAVGMGSLPGDIPVEIEAVFEVK